MKRLMIMLALPLFIALTAAPEAGAQWVNSIPDGEGNFAYQIMEPHTIRDAALSAADSLHVSDAGWGKWFNLADVNIDSVAILYRSSDSLCGRMILDQYTIPGVRDTTGVEFAITNDAGGSFRYGWFQLSKTLMAGTGVRPLGLNVHTQVHTYGTTYAGAPQVASEKFDVWLLVYRKEP